MEIRDKVIEIMNEICNAPVTGSEDDLFESGALDSLAVLQLVVELSDSFGIDLDVDDVTFDNFCTVEHIVKLIEERK